MASLAPSILPSHITQGATPVEGVLEASEEQLSSMMSTSNACTQSVILEKLIFSKGVNLQPENPKLRFAAVLFVKSSRVLQETFLLYLALNHKVHDAFFCAMRMNAVQHSLASSDLTPTQLDLEWKYTFGGDRQEMLLKASAGPANHNILLNCSSVSI
jgi:hypothetical protein